MASGFKRLASGWPHIVGSLTAHGSTSGAPRIVISSWAIQPIGPAAPTPPSVLPLVAFVHFQHHQCSIDGRKSLSICSLSAACNLAFLPYAARGGGAFSYGSC